MIGFTIGLVAGLVGTITFAYWRSTQVKSAAQTPNRTQQLEAAVTTAQTFLEVIRGSPAAEPTSAKIADRGLRNISAILDEQTLPEQKEARDGN